MLTWWQSARELFGLAFVLAVFGVPVILVGWGPISLLQQCRYWLEHAVWQPRPWSQALAVLDVPYPRVDARGLQLIIDWFMDAPASVMMPVTGMALIVGFLLGAEWVERRYPWIGDFLFPKTAAENRSQQGAELDKQPDSPHLGGRS